VTATAGPALSEIGKNRLVRDLARARVVRWSTIDRGRWVAMSTVVGSRHHVTLALEKRIVSVWGVSPARASSASAYVSSIVIGLASWVTGWPPDSIVGWMARIPRAPANPPGAEANWRSTGARPSGIATRTSGG
jgi:hypothetical protein